MTGPTFGHGRGGHSGWRSGRSRRWPAVMPVLVVLAVVAILFALSRRLAHEPSSVVVYTAQDQVYAEPVLQAFERQTGIRVRAVYDSEAVKTVGLVNRLLAERDHPQCDVFWNNEELRIRQLAARGVLDDRQPWVALGYRSRRLVINTNRLSLDEAPGSLLALTNRVWRRQVALAYPLFGTTATHFLALHQSWGDPDWKQWCEALAANEPRVVDGNSLVVNLVGRGEVSVGLTDSDDVAAGQRAGLPIVALPLTDESLLIPNTVAIVRGAPHPVPARQLMDYLERPQTVQRLVAAHALEAAAGSFDSIGLKPDWEHLLRKMEEDSTFLKEVFLR